MKSRLIALFILLISFNAQSYVPLFLAQESLNGLPEKLIIQVQDITSESLPNVNEGRLHFYQVTMRAEIKFIGETNSSLHEGDIINIFYKTSEMKNGLRPLLGYMPIRVPEKQELCIVYLTQDASGNYNIDTYWALQILTTEHKNNILNDDETPQWIKEGITNILPYYQML